MAAATPARRSLGTWLMGRRRRSTCQAPATPYTQAVSKRDPHAVLGIEPGANPTQVKAAWRRLARKHHPDLTGDDPEASRVATRQMAEINDAYAALTRPGGGARWAEDPGTAAAREARDYSSAGARRGGPPQPKPTRPVTARVDTTGTVRPRNQSIRTGGSWPLRLHAERASARADPDRAAGAAPGQHPDRAPGPLPDPQLPPAGQPATPRRSRARARVRQVPRPHARPGGCVRAVVHRLAGYDDHPRPRSRRGRTGRPRRPGLKGIVRHERPPATPSRSGRTA